MAAVSLFGGTNMATVTSSENQELDDVDGGKVTNLHIEL